MKPRLDQSAASQLTQSATEMCEAVDGHPGIGKSEVDCAAKFLGKDGADCGGYNACIAAIPRP